MLASDVNNPEFLGAVANPDQALIVSFYTRPVQNIFKSAKQERPIYEDVTYITINVPGLKDMQVDRPAYESDKRRFPLQWQHFENRTKGDAREIGTPLSEWQQLTRSQAEEFRALKFYTVEAIANASDLNINALGMVGGMSPYVLRDKARAFLASAKGLPDDRAKLEAELAALKEQVAKLQPQNAAPQPAPALAGQVTPPQPAAVAAQPEVKRKRGRPSKADIAARQQAST